MYLEKSLIKLWAVNLNLSLEWIYPKNYVTQTLFIMIDFFNFYRLGTTTIKILKPYNSEWISYKWIFKVNRLNNGVKLFFIKCLFKSIAQWQHLVSKYKWIFFRWDKKRNIVFLKFRIQVIQVQIEVSTDFYVTLFPWDRCMF